MRRFTFILAVVLAATPVLADTTAFVNVNLIPMTSAEVIPAQTVVVEGGIITAIGGVDSVPVPEEADLVDGTDRYLMPGLTEMHGHVTGTGSAEINRLFSLYLANGVTTVRGMLGRESHLQLRQDIADGAVLGPRLITSGPSFNGNSVTSASQGASMVREQHAAGYDFLKIHPGLTRSEFIAVADTANELGIPFAGHVPAAVGLDVALDKGMATIDHLDGYMASLLPANTDTSGGYGGFFDVMLADQAIEDRIDMVVAATIKAGVGNVPTESLFEQLVNDVPASDLASQAEMRYMPHEIVSRWKVAKNETQTERGFDPLVAAQAIEIRRQLILALHEAGGVLLLGSDAPQIFNVPGFSLHHELEFMVASGLTPFEALQTGTITPALFFGINTGTVETGKVADLVLLDANPLEDIGNSGRVHGVVAAGRWFTSAELLNGLD